MWRPSPETTAHSIAAVLTATMMVGLFFTDSLEREQPREHPAMVLTLEEAPPAPAPPAPAAPAPTPPKPEPVRKPQLEHHQHVLAQAPEQPPPDRATSDEGAVSVAPAAAAPPPPAGGDRVSLEAEYAAALRRIVDAHTSVPESPEYRLVRPRGESAVSFRIDRLGKVEAVTLARSSGSRMLDERALEIVSSARYPPFPAAAFPGESRHDFLVTIEFRS
jgi:protein TonB